MNKKSVLAQRTLLASIIFLLIAALCVVAFADYTELTSRLSSKKKVTGAGSLPVKWLEAI